MRRRAFGRALGCAALLLPAARCQSGGDDAEEARVGPPPMVVAGLVVTQIRKTLQAPVDAVSRLREAVDAQGLADIDAAAAWMRSADARRSTIFPILAGSPVRTKTDEPCSGLTTIEECCAVAQVAADDPLQPRDDGECLAAAEPGQVIKAGGPGGGGGGGGSDDATFCMTRADVNEARAITAATGCGLTEPTFSLAVRTLPQHGQVQSEADAKIHLLSHYKVEQTQDGEDWVYSEYTPDNWKDHTEAADDVDGHVVEQALVDFETQADGDARNPWADNSPVSGLTGELWTNKATDTGLGAGSWAGATCGPCMGWSADTTPYLYWEYTEVHDLAGSPPWGSNRVAYQSGLDLTHWQNYVWRMVVNPGSVLAFVSLLDAGAGSEVLAHNQRRQMVEVGCAEAACMVTVNDLGEQGEMFMTAVTDLEPGKLRTVSHDPYGDYKAGVWDIATLKSDGGEKTLRLCMAVTGPPSTGGKGGKGGKGAKGGKNQTTSSPTVPVVDNVIVVTAETSGAAAAAAAVLIRTFPAAAAALAISYYT